MVPTLLDFLISLQKMSPAQVSWLLNFTAGAMHGAQASGLINFAAKEVRGAQISGLINVAPRKITGAQVSGLLNYATKVKGTQIGVINIADSIKGIPFGFFSFVLKGHHQIEISADEIFYTNVAFRTGVRHFYNIFTVGAKPDTFSEEETYWTFGYGIGTSPKLTNWLNLSVDLTANQVVKGKTIDAVNLLNKLYLGVEIYPVKKVALTWGLHSMDTLRIPPNNIPICSRTTCLTSSVITPIAMTLI